MNKIYQIDAGTGKKEIISTKELKRRLTGYYYDINLAIEAMKRGQTIRTAFYFYEFKK